MKIKTLISAITTVFCVLLIIRSAMAQQAVPIDGGSVLRNLKYGDGPAASNMLDLYLPDDKFPAPFPLIVWIHGGGWEQGNKNDTPAVGAIYFGYAVASMNYRLSHQAIFPAQIQDCRAAIRWLRANANKYKINPDRIGVWGASAGGHLSALLGTSGAHDKPEWDTSDPPAFSCDVQAVCDWYGPTDLEQLWNSSMSTHRWDKQKNPLSRLFGGPVPEKSILASTANPIPYITPKAPPFLIMHGDRDTLVPLSQSQLLQDALKKAGVETDLIVVSGNGHGGQDFLNPLNRAKILAFFDRHLKKK